MEDEKALRARLLPIFSYNLTTYQQAASRAGMNKKSIASRGNFSQSHWGDLLNGKIPGPSIWTCVRISEALHIPIDALATTDNLYRVEVSDRVEAYWTNIRNKGTGHAG
jgi:hypothetical protein